MSGEEPVKARVIIEPTADGVRVLAPAPHGRWVPAGLAALVLLGIFASLATVLFASAASRTAAEVPAGLRAAFVAGVLLLPAALDGLILWAFVELLYRAAGSERITASPWMLADARRVGFLSASRRWGAIRVSGLRLSPMSGGAPDVRAMSRRGILFEVDGRHTRSMCEGCTPGEASDVLDAVRAALSRPTITRTKGPGCDSTSGGTAKSS